jgi:hypothetical protein
VLTRTQPTAAQRADIAFASRSRRRSATSTSGQTVVVKDRAVIAVEAIEGTDAALAAPGAIAVGRVRGEGGQALAGPALRRADDRPGTVAVLAEAKIAVLAIEAGATGGARARRGGARGGRARDRDRRGVGGVGRVSALRIAVIGAGVMGGHHARKVRDRAQREGDVVLVGVCDAKLERAQRVGGELGAPAAAEPAELFAQADAAIVAVSAVAHYEVARRALEAGLDVLVEKPIAATLPEADALVELARSRARVLQVGHQEWFNAAMRVVREQIDRPRFAEIHRLGRSPSAAPTSTSCAT